MGYHDYTPFSLHPVPPPSSPPPPFLFQYLQHSGIIDTLLQLFAVITYFILVDSLIKRGVLGLIREAPPFDLVIAEFWLHCIFKFAAGATGISSPFLTIRVNQG